MANTPKLTPKQENFCLAYLETGNASEAYRRAYDAENMKPETINRNAFAVLENNKIAARLSELREPIVKAYQITVMDLVQELEEARQAALGAETPQWQIMLALFVRGLGLAGSMMPAFAVAYATLSRGDIPDASSQLNVVQRVGGSIGSALMAKIKSNRAKSAALI